MDKFLSLNASPVLQQHDSKVYAVIRTTIAILYFVFAFSTTLLFWSLSRHDLELSKRFTSLTIMAGFANTLAGSIIMINGGMWGEFPCFVPFVVQYLFVIPVFLSLIGRSMRFLLYWRLNRIKSMEHGLLNEGSRPKVGCLDALLPKRHDAIDRYIWCTVGLQFILNAGYVGFTLVTAKTQVPVVASVALHPKMSYLCPILNVYYFFFAAYLINCAFIAPLMLIFAWSKDDNNGIRTDLIISTTVGTCSIVLYFIWFLVPSRWRAYFDGYIWIWFYLLAIQISSISVPALQSLRSMCFKPKRIGWDNFEAMLTNPAEFEAFKAHSVQDFCAENTRFIEEYYTLRNLTLEYFRNLYIATNGSPPPPLSGLSDQEIDLPTTPISRFLTDLSPTATLPDNLLPAYISFYLLFIHSGAVLEVNISGDVKTEVRRRVECPGGMTITIFDAALREVLSLLFFDTFPRYIAKSTDVRKRFTFQPLVGIAL